MARVGVLAGAIGLAAPASAQSSPDASIQADAKARLQQGVKAYSQGRYKDAVDLFLVANRLVPSPALSFNIAKAYEKLGDTPAALNWYRDYLRRAPGAPDEAAVGKIIRKYEGVLRDRGVQQVTVLSAPPGATVVIDGEPMGVAPWTGELPPGKHTLTAQLRGYADVTKDFELAPERAMDLSIALEKADAASTPEEDEEVASPEPAAAVEPTPAAPAPDPRADTGGIGAPTWIALGLGGAALGAALGFELSRRNAERTARDAATQVEARDAFETMEDRQTAARILAGTGGALLLVGGVLLVVDLSRGGDAEQTGATAFGAGCAGAGCQLTLRGRL